MSSSPGGRRWGGGGFSSFAGGPQGQEELMINASGYTAVIIFEPAGRF